MPSAAPRQEARTDLEHTRPRWRQLPGDDLISGYLLAVHLDAWEDGHAGWTMDYWADTGLWEAVRRTETTVTVVCRASLEDAEARVEEILRQEAAGQAPPGPPTPGAGRQ